MPPVPNDSHQEVRVSWIQDLEQWRRLEPEWPELLGNSNANAVFLTWEWLDSWLEIYGDGGRLAVLVARDAAGRLVGAAPMMLDRGAGSAGRWMRRVILLGQKADTASEYLDWILRKGHEAAAAAALCEYLFKHMRKDWDILRFEAMRADSTTLPLLKSYFARQGRATSVSHATTAPYLRLPDTWEAFLASRSGTFRQRWNKFNREHTVALKQAGADLSVAEGMTIIQDLNAQRWGDRRQSFLSDRYARFHQKVAPRLQEAGHLAMLFLQADGQIVAGRYDFSYAGKAWCFQGGWLPEWEKERAGKMMLTMMMRWCIDHGLAEYDFLGGPASYKNDWSSNAERRMVDLQAANPASVRGRLFDLLRRYRRKQRSPGGETVGEQLA